jgi:hypothetical protein
MVAAQWKTIWHLLININSSLSFKPKLGKVRSPSIKFNFDKKSGFFKRKTLNN